jgi:hypothetical protein
MQIRRHLELVANAYEDFKITDGTHTVSVKELINDIGKGISAALMTEDNFKGIDKYHEGTGNCFDCIGYCKGRKAIKGDFGDCSSCVRNFRRAKEVETDMVER